MEDFKPKSFADSEKKIVVFHGLCKGCGLCLEKCPQKAISFSKSDLGVYNTPTIEIHLNKCNSCGICEIICPESAIKLEKNG